MALAPYVYMGAAADSKRRLTLELSGAHATLPAEHFIDAIAASDRAYAIASASAQAKC